MAELLAADQKNVRENSAGNNSSGQRNKIEQLNPMRVRTKPLANN